MSVVAASFLVTGITFGRFSGAKTQTGANTVAAGTISVGSPSVTQACALSGVLPGNSTSTATLTTALSSATNYTSLAVTPLTKAIATNDKLLIGEGTTTQIVTASAAAAVNATSVSVTSFAANANYIVDVMVTDLTTQNTPCTFHITYTGNLSAYVAADVLVVGGDATHPALWDSTSTGLQLVMTDGATNTYTVPSTALSSCASVGSQFGTFPNGRSCGEVNNDVVTTVGVANGSSYTLSLNWVLPTSSTTGYQNGNAQIYVSFHAVQRANNTINCTPSTAVGKPCTPVGTFKWS